MFVTSRPHARAVPPASQAKRRRNGWWSAYPARSRPLSRAQRRRPATLALVVVLVLWWAATRAGAVPAVLLPNPVAVAGRVVTWTLDGTVWRYLWPTVAAALLGSLMATVTALVLGIVSSHSRWLAAIVEPFVAFSQTVPLVALAPLLALWIGYGTLPIAVLAAIIAFFPMITTTVVGLRGIDMRMIENAWLDGANSWQRLIHIELPIAAPAILAGIRAGFVLSMTGAIVGEFVIGGSGLGTLLTISREATDTTGVFAVLVVIAAVALAFAGLIQKAERASIRRLQGESI